MFDNVGDPGMLEHIFTDSGFWVCDLSQAEKLWYNRNFWCSLGYKPNQVDDLATNWQKYVHHDDWQVVSENFIETVSQPLAEHIIRVRNSQGLTVWLKLKRNLLNFIQDQQPLLIITFVDVSTQMLTLQSLRQDMEIYRYIRDGDHFFIAKTDLEGYFIFANELYAQSLQTRVDQLPGKSSHSYYRQEDIAQRIKAYQYCIFNPGLPYKVGLTTLPQPESVLQTWTFYGLIDEYGKVSEIICFGKDSSTENPQQGLIPPWMNEDLTWNISYERMIQSASATWQAYFGYKATDLEGMGAMELIHPEDIPAVKSAISKAMTGQSSQVEHRIRRAESQWIWALTRIKNEEYRNELSLNSYDITDTKLLTEKLVFSQQIFEQTSEIAKVGGWEYNVASRKLYWSKIAREIHDEKEGTDISLDWALQTYVSTDDKERLTEAARLAFLGVPWDIEGEIKTSKGNRRWVRSKGRAQIENGLCIRLYGTLQDITDHKIAQQQLIITKQQLEQTGRMARVGGWEYLVDSQSSHWSDITKEIFEVPADFRPDVTSGLDFFPEHNDRQLVKTLFENAIEKGIPWDVESKIKTKSGRLLWIRTIGQTDWHNGSCTRVYGTFQDIDDRKASEEQVHQAMLHAENASRVKSEFIANINHEIRTPLNGILGLSELLLTTDLDEVQQNYVQVVHQSADLLSSIVKNILDFSKNEHGQTSLIEAKTDVVQLGQEIINAFSLPAQRKGLQLTLKLSENLPAYIWVDAVRIKQILVNLIGNAIKFTDHGEVVFEINAFQFTEGRVSVRFLVSDTGIGIAQKDYKRIFEPFIQGDLSSTKRYDGTGLGLAISKDLLIKMKSGFELISTEGLGSTFSFVLNLKAESDHSEDVEISQQIRSTLIADISAPEQMAARYTSVLVVEDNLVNRIVIRKMIEIILPGSKIQEAKDGLEGLHMFDQLRPSLVLMDIQMPNMNGYDCSVAIRKLEISGERVPIVAITANATLEDRERCLLAGMDELIGKPFHTSEIELVIKGLK